MAKQCYEAYIDFKTYQYYKDSQPASQIDRGT